VARVIAVANQKGGVGKTTTTINLGASLAVAEQRVLVVDMDPQGNLSSGLGFPKHLVEEHVYHVLTGEREADDVILATELEYLHLLPTQTDLIGAEIELVDAQERHLRLSHAFATLDDAYDYILIDCPPSLGLLTLNALVAAEAVLVPLQCEYYALEGLSHLLATIDRVRGSYNRGLALEGILLCMYDKRMNLTRQVAQEVRDHFADKVFSTVIPRNVRLGEAPSFGKPALLYDIESKGALAYLDLATELLEEHEKAQNKPRPAAPRRRRRRAVRRG